MAAAALALWLFVTFADNGATWLPLTRSDLAELLAGGKNGGAVKIETLDALFAAAETGREPQISKREHWLQAEKSRLSNILASGETVWVASNADIPLTIVAAGKAERIHTLRIQFPIVNYSESQAKRAQDTLSDLFTRIYPEWAEAREWPRQSLQDAWDTYRPNAIKSPNDRIVRKAVDGITSATFGVPPDIVVYTVTVRERCIPDAGQRGLFQRIIC